MARKSSTPAAEPKSTGASDRRRLLETLKRHPRLSVRQEAFRQLQPLVAGFYQAREKEWHRLAEEDVLALAARTKADAQLAARAMQKLGYVVLFRDDLVHLNPQSRHLLRAFDYDADEIRSIMAGEEWVTAGDLLAEHKYQACFVKGSAPRTGSLLFSTPAGKMNRAQFWHETFHAFQHRHNLYEAFSKRPGTFWLRELEASAFVIGYAGKLGIPRSDLMTELRIWAMRLEEYLEQSSRAKKPRFSAIG